MCKAHRYIISPSVTLWVTPSSSEEGRRAKNERKDRYMKYPMINRQPRREVNVPQLSGGLNLRDSLTGIRDNQMTDCVNMWYKEGMLRTRPAIGNANSILGELDYIEKTKVFYDIAKDDAVLVSYCAKTVAGGANFNFFWQNKDSLTFVGRFTDYFYAMDEEIEYFVTEKNGVLYCYTGKFNIYKCEFKTGSNVWKLVEQAEMYVPTVYVHCNRSGWDDFTSTMFEGYNLLTNKYKMVYSAYNKNDSDKTHPMRYKLGQNLPRSGEIKVEITSCDLEKEDVKTVKHCINYTPEEYDLFSKGDILIEKFSDGIESEDGLYLFVKYNYVGFLFESEFTYTNGIAEINSDDLIKKYACNDDNIVITAPVEFNNKEKSKIFNMSQSIWFGGAANGIKDGSRLFLCGNTAENEGALVIWSSVDKPLYFPENNYVYVGNKAHPVTAFGKQGENLIIFKEKSTYYSYYNVNDNITADDLINQSVVDYEANSAIFPMIQLNANIGCDCPDTVQLCRNRLVWLNSEGRAYTLVSANQYSEMTIYPVSDMIEQRIKATYSTEQLKAATSHDFEGHYVLMIGCDAYVMDYNSYGYTHIYSYSKTEDANGLIPWYYWKFSIQGENVRFYGFKDFIFSFYKQSNDGALTFCVLSNSGVSDNFYKEKIVSCLQTKMFDFSAAGYLKNVDRVSIAFGNNGGEPINVGFLTDKGSESDVVTLAGSSTDERDAAFVTVKNFYVSARAMRTFGVKIECEGPLIIDGLSLQYRMLGGVK